MYMTDSLRQGYVYMHKRLKEITMTETAPTSCLLLLRHLKER